MSGAAETQQLNPAQLQSIVDRLVAEFAPRAIYFFGSRAYGTPHRDSDIDLMIVVGHAPDSRFELV